MSGLAGTFLLLAFFPNNVRNVKIQTGRRQEREDKMKLVFQSKTTSSAVTGYLIFSLIFSVLFALMFEDPMFLVFGVFILMAFILATAIDVGDINKDLASVGWSSTNIKTAVPLGIIGGIVTLVIGSFMVNINMMHPVVPDFSSLGKFFTKASVISPLMAVSANIISQWLVVAPAEESLSKIIAPYAGIMVFKDKIFAFFLAILLWTAMHIPTFVMQGVGSSMYFVLILFGVISAVLFFMTNSILTPIIAHGVFNTVIILSSSGDTYSTLVILVVAAVLLLVWSKSSKGANHA